MLPYVSSNFSGTRSIWRSVAILAEAFVVQMRALWAFIAFFVEMAKSTASSASSVPCSETTVGGGGQVSVLPSSLVVSSAAASRSGGDAGGGCISAGPSAGDVVPGTFICRLCTLRLPLEEMSVCKPGQCKRDTATYKSLADTWKADKKVRTWWQALSPAQQADEYKTQRNVPVGQKRKFDMTQYGDRRITEGFQTDRFVDMLQPYSEFEIPYLFKGWEEPDILALFAKIVDENRSECVFE